MRSFFAISLGQRPCNKTLIQAKVSPRYAAGIHEIVIYLNLDLFKHCTFSFMSNWLLNIAWKNLEKQLCYKFETVSKSALTMLDFVSRNASFQALPQTITNTFLENGFTDLDLYFFCNMSTRCTETYTNYLLIQE